MKVLVLPTVSVLLLCLGASDGCIIPECPKNHYDDVIYLPSPTDCSKYYVCVHSEPIQMSCPLGLWFDSQLNVCNWPEEVNCNSKYLFITGFSNLHTYIIDLHVLLVHNHNFTTYF